MARPSKLDWDAFAYACATVLITFVLILAGVLQYKYGRPYREAGFVSGNRYYEYTD